MGPDVTFAAEAGRAAEHYDRYFVPTIPAPLADHLLATAALRPGEHVVDVACGTGVVARRAAPIVGVTGRVVGVDPNPGMLAVAQSLDAPAGASVEWRPGRAEHLPLPDQSFDYALCQLGLMFFSDRSAGLREIGRVLAPGGRLALNVPGPMPPLFGVMAEALRRRVGPEASRFVEGVFSLADAGDLAELLHDAGFGEVETATSVHALPLPPPTDFLWQYVHSTPLGAAVATTTPEARAGLEEDVLRGWEELVVDGRLTLRIPVTVATAQV